LAAFDLPESGPGRSENENCLGRDACELPPPQPALSAFVFDCGEVSVRLIGDAGRE